MGHRVKLYNSLVHFPNLFKNFQRPQLVLYKYLLVFNYIYSQYNYVRLFTINRVSQKRSLSFVLIVLYNILNGSYKNKSWERDEFTNKECAIIEKNGAQRNVVHSVC